MYVCIIFSNCILKIRELELIDGVECHASGIKFHRWDLITNVRFCKLKQHVTSSIIFTTSFTFTLSVISLYLSYLHDSVFII